VTDAIPVRVPTSALLDHALEQARRAGGELEDRVRHLDPVLSWKRRSGAAPQAGASYADGHANAMIVGPGGLEDRKTFGSACRCSLRMSGTSMRRRTSILSSLTANFGKVKVNGSRRVLVAPCTTSRIYFMPWLRPRTLRFWLSRACSTRGTMNAGVRPLTHSTRRWHTSRNSTSRYRFATRRLHRRRRPCDVGLFTARWSASVTNHATSRPQLFLRCHSDILVGVVLGTCVWEALDGGR